MQANILVYDVGSTYTKVSAFCLKNKEFLYMGRGQSPTTLEDIMAGVRQAEQIFQEDFQVSIAPDAQRYSSCSAAGGLRMVAMGHMPRVTAKAAKEVAMTAGARIMEVLSTEIPTSYRTEALREIDPDIILLAGGTDSGDETSVAENVKIIGQVHGKAMVILACNRSAQRPAAEELKKAGVPCVRVPNLMPTIHELNVKPARDAIHEQFIRQITRAKGLEDLRDTLADRTVVPTPGAVLLASELLAKGTYDQDGVGGLILVDIGGATTDIHSALPKLEELKLEERGLVINNEKQFSYRTVEGNLGLRVSATGIPEAVGPLAVIRAMDQRYDDVSPQDILEHTEALERDTGHIPADEREACLDRALASCAASVALRRHAGSYAQENDPVMGIMAGTAIGRDLRTVRRVLCAGGIFSHGPADLCKRIVSECFRYPGISLFPLHAPEICLDREYILYAMGVLGRHYPDAALTFMKKHIIERGKDNEWA